MLSILKLTQINKNSGALSIWMDKREKNPETIKKNKLGMVVYTCNGSSRKAEAGGSQVWDPVSQNKTK
jgi:hypothetical protein